VGSRAHGQRWLLFLSRAAKAALAVSVLITAFGALWEYSTRCYLSGFSDAVVPSGAPPEEKVAAILSWMQNGPSRTASDPSTDSGFEFRNPEITLNNRTLLKVCGTATNAFVNLADTAGLQARRLLLLSNGSVAHVVAEVNINGRWVVVDPAFGVILKDSAGHLLTREDLANPDVLHTATQSIPAYSSLYTYTHTSHVHLEAFPWLGHWLHAALDATYPQWQESFDWTLLLERDSYAFCVAGSLLLLLSLFANFFLFCVERLRGIAPPPPAWHGERERRHPSSGLPVTLAGTDLSADVQIPVLTAAATSDPIER